MRTGYNIALPPGITFDVVWEDASDINTDGVKNYVDGLARPSWYIHDNSNNKDTRLYMMEVYQPFRPKEIEGKLTRSWKCENCQGVVLYEGLHLGHKTNWRTELKAAAVKTAAEAKAAYNNLLNLRIECSTCNQSHDWE
jgi:hypothetical protein